MKPIRTMLAVLAVSTLLLAAVPSHGVVGEEPVLVGTDATGDAPIDPSTAAIGLDMIGIFIQQTDASTLEFTWQVTELPSAPPPEIVRYFWNFTVDGVAFAVQAKTTDVATTASADDPAGSVTHLPGTFRLRGNCELIGGTLNNCHHLKFVEGTFDTANAQVRVKVPLGDPAAPGITEGAVIETLTAEAGIQVVASFPNTSTDTANPCGVYTIGADNSGPIGCE